MDAVDCWPDLDTSPPVAEFVDADNLNGLFKARAIDETGHIPSVEFLFQDALVTIMYGSTVRVIVERDN
jgi:hypothetical protein